MQTAAAEPSRPPVSPEPLLRSLIGFEVSQVLMAAHYLGVFRELATEPCLPEKLCAKLSLSTASGGRLLQACVALGLLDQHNGTLSNTAAVSMYLDPSKATYIGGLLEYYRTEVYLACARLPDAILQNGPQVLDRNGEASDI